MRAQKLIVQKKMHLAAIKNLEGFPRNDIFMYDKQTQIIYIIIFKSKCLKKFKL